MQPEDILRIPLSREQVVWLATALGMVDLSIAGVSPERQECLKQWLIDNAKKEKSL